MSRFIQPGYITQKKGTTLSKKLKKTKIAGHDMKRVKLPKIVFTCFPSVPMILFLFFFLPYLVSKQHKLLFSTYEFIVVVKSSRVAVFAVFNVIVITIFLGRPKPSSVDGFCLPSASFSEGYNNEEEKDYNEDIGSYGGEERGVHHGDDGYDEENDDGLDTEDADGEDERDVDLERRIEAFIAQVYKKRREETLAERLHYYCIQPPS